MRAGQQSLDDYCHHPGRDAEGLKGLRLEKSVEDPSLESVSVEEHRHCDCTDVVPYFLEWGAQVLGLIDRSNKNKITCS